MDDSRQRKIKSFYDILALSKHIHTIFLISRTKKITKKTDQDIRQLYSKVLEVKDLRKPLELSLELAVKFPFEESKKELLKLTLEVDNSEKKLIGLGNTLEERVKNLRLFSQLLIAFEEVEDEGLNLLKAVYKRIEAQTANDKFHTTEYTRQELLTTVDMIMQKFIDTNKELVEFLEKFVPTNNNGEYLNPRQMFEDVYTILGYKFA